MRQNEIKRVLWPSLMGMVAVFLMCFLPTFSWAVTQNRVVECMNSEQLAFVAQANSYKEQGYSKKELIARLKGDIPPDTKVQILKSINYVYDLTHEVSPSVTFFTDCLNK